MKKTILTLALIIGVVGLKAQEVVNLTAPITKPNISSCKLDRMTLDITNSVVTIGLICTDIRINKEYDSNTNPTGAALLTALNRANFTVNSLIKAVYNRLITDGVVTGTVTGTAQ